AWVQVRLYATTSSAANRTSTAAPTAGAVKPIASPIGSWSSVVIVRPGTDGASPVPPVDGVDGPEGFVLGSGAVASVSTDGPDNALDAVAMTSVSPPTTAPRRNCRRST